MSESYPYERWLEETEAERRDLEDARATFGDETDRLIARGLREKGWSLADIAVLFSMILEQDVAPSVIARWELAS